MLRIAIVCPYKHTRDGMFRWTPRIQIHVHTLCVKWKANIRSECLTWGLRYVCAWDFTASGQFIMHSEPYIHYIYCTCIRVYVCTPSASRKDMKSEHWDGKKIFLLLICCILLFLQRIHTTWIDSGVTQTYKQTANCRSQMKGDPHSERHGTSK